MEAKELQLNQVMLKLNSIAQHNRSWSIRVNGVELSNEEETNSRAVKNKLFDTVLRPILQGAVECGDLDEIPAMEKVLEHAHILPAKDRQSKPIIARFTGREYRALVFKHKKAYAPREASAGASRERPGRYKYPLFEDLTKVTFGKMRAIASHPRVEACWSSGGQLRFKIKDSTYVHKVRSVLDSVEDIISPLLQ